MKRNKKLTVINSEANVTLPASLINDGHKRIQIRSTRFAPCYYRRSYHWDVLQ